MATTEAVHTYRGNCHCGAFVYEVDLPEIKSVYDCNCSICHKKGYLWVFPGEGSFRTVKGTDDTLASYSFGPKKLLHKVGAPRPRLIGPWLAWLTGEQFCPTCATPVMGQFLNGPPGRQQALNVRAMQDVNTWDLEKIAYDGASLGDKYVPPEYKDKGNLPAVPDGCKLYTGGCHCGAVGVALVSKPLDETFDETTVECNCSTCERNGYVWAYPETQQVVLAGDEANIGRYSAARPILSKTFCKVCGVCLTNEQKPLSDEQRSAMSELERKWAGFMETHRPANLRVFPDVDLTRMKPSKKVDMAKMGPPYAKP